MIKTLAAIALTLSFVSAANDKPIAIAIHGGAGTISKAKMTPEVQAQYEAKLAQAVDRGYALLAEGKSSEEAVIATIQILEDSPLFNAGVGSVYTYDETHELDASVMDGKTLNAGAVAGVKTVKSPIALASEIMHNSVHVMLSGDGAAQFAKEQGLEMVDNSHFNTQRRLDSLKRAKQKLGKVSTQEDYIVAHEQLAPAFKMGTVGAVALDSDGNLYAGTSTGGMTAKRYGRIGDAPIIGAGTYANNESCAVSATGHGEYFIRYHVAADICARVQYQQKSVEQAGSEVIFGPMFKAGGTGGVIIVDAKGNIAMPFNTSGMYRASKSNVQPRYVAIFKE
ncbi:isoaspartyl peptidase/L-asparaginase family protein [Thalassotalea agarivorans]|uniref:Isoaspartyl peptidase n=1 Tax=Thalassotalea agarivorans TaxID=349064 RepID=A0A1I0EWM0_THASX|nr:isoaspartyl peptidase/L-asparaginase [Thalassotalea agarivorans]SET50055.1 beta-aspartyl-peptidase (threonine type) [Thalassotalea agarivorans]